MIVTINEKEYTCDKAIKGVHHIHLLNDNETVLFNGNFAEWDNTTISGGEWTFADETTKMYFYMQELITQMTADNADRDELIAELLEEGA